jgi:D-alanyl-D-alanine dipeptidase
MKTTLTGIIAVWTAACASVGTAAAPQQLPDLVSVVDVDPTIVVEARYYGSHNFIGRPIDGYEAPKCLLAREAALALAEVQADVRAFGLGLKTYDCYRPQRAVADFARWARDLADTKMKAEFYPDLDKSQLFELGYIAERSGHSRGSTVDLTLVPLAAPSEAAYRDGDPLVRCTAPRSERFRDDSLDMGTGYDCFSELSHTENPDVGPVAARNRLLLKSVMEKHGFVNYAQEWWHFTLLDEPYPQTYFDVPVR